MTYEIFVPFWGDPDQLYETVESVRAQTDPDPVSYTHLTLPTTPYV